MTAINFFFNCLFLLLSTDSCKTFPQDGKFVSTKKRKKQKIGYERDLHLENHYYIGNICLVYQ